MQHPFHWDPFACKALNKRKSVNCTKSNPEIKPRVIIYVFNNVEGCALNIPVLRRLFHHKRFISSINYSCTSVKMRPNPVPVMSQQANMLTQEQVKPEKSESAVSVLAEHPNALCPNKLPHPLRFDRLILFLPAVECLLLKGQHPLGWVDAQHIAASAEARDELCARSARQNFWHYP